METRIGEVQSDEDTERGAKLVSALEEVFIHAMSSDPVFILEVISETWGLWVISRVVSARAMVVTESYAGRTVSVRGVMMVSVDPVTGWTEIMGFVSVDISGDTVDELETAVVLTLEEATSVVYVVVSVCR